jgi:hypothetical protein
MDASLKTKVRPVGNRVKATGPHAQGNRVNDDVTQFPSPVMGGFPDHAGKRAGRDQY